MKKHLFLLVVLMALLTGCKGDADSVACVRDFDAQETVFVPQDGRHHEAILTDTYSLNHVSSPRPQRILPVGSIKHVRLTYHSGFVRLRSINPPHYPHDGRRRVETAPFCLSALSDYYVIALRHIIR